MGVKTKLEYSSDFYDQVSETSLPSAQVIVPLVLGVISISSVLDVGCGTGAWLSVFQEHGVKDLTGIDSDYVRSDALLIGPDRVVRKDLSKSFDLGRRFDLVISLEVGEHLPQSSSKSFVESIARHGDLVLFSAALPGQEGTHHINTQWPSWWTRLFLDHGFEVFDLLRPQIWDDPSVALWYRNNILLFARKGQHDHLRQLSSLVGRPLDIVHPQRWQGKIERPPKERELGLGELVGALPGAVMSSLRYRLRRKSLS